MNNTVYVIHEHDYDDDSKSVIGVATSHFYADVILDKYYGKYTLDTFNNVRDSGIEWVKIITVEGLNGRKYQSKITLESFRLNENNFIPFLMSGKR